MAGTVAGPGPAPLTRRGFWGAKPHTTLGWWGLVLAAIAVAISFALPFITTAYRETYPITDSWVMPVIGLAVLDIAALFNLGVLVWAKERSVTSLIVTVLIGFAGFFFTAMVVGEGLAGV